MNIHVNRHDKKGREEILKVHLNIIKTEENLDIDTLPGLTSSMVGADLANLINKTALLTARRGKRISFLASKLFDSDHGQLHLNAY
jgi:cell division protease FtsH